MAICALLLASLPAVGGMESMPVSTDGWTGSAASFVAKVIQDPASGQSIAVWSATDGQYSKIVYSRLVDGIWSDFHYVTFGRGNDTHPRIALTQDGAILFWISSGQRYMYAPIDLSAGRLYAVPRHIPLRTAGLQTLSGGGTKQDGGTDVPIIVEDCPEGQEDCVPLEPTPDPANRFQILSEGGTDVPIIADVSLLWSVTGRSDCSLLIMTLPESLSGAYHVVRFERAGWKRAGKIRVVPGDFKGLRPQQAADSVLESSCH
jgi:hypothetical protein